MHTSTQAQLAAIGAQMGATIKLDLTSDVTHLIVGSTDSAKYRYVAKSRDDVKVLSPTWLEALRDVWMQGDDNVDVATLEASHRLPALFGLKICLTGFDNRKVEFPRLEKTRLTTHSRAAKAYSGNGRHERRRIPRRSDQICHAPYRGDPIRQKVRTRTQLEDENCLVRVV